MRRKQTWPCLRKQLLSYWIHACPNYIVSQPQSLCPSVVSHRRNISAAFSISVVMFAKSECLLCALCLLLCLAKYSAAPSPLNCYSLYCRYSVEFIVTFLMDRELSKGFQSP